MADYNINAVTRRVQYTGSAGVGPYAFTFEILNETDIAVYFNSTLLSLTVDYTVTINANGTGSITIVTGTRVPTTPDADDQITILGARDIERTTDFLTAGDLKASSLNEELDSVVIFDQQVSERINRSISVAPYDLSAGLTLPLRADRANKFLTFDSFGAVSTSALSGLSELIVDSITLDGNSITIEDKLAMLSQNDILQLYTDGGEIQLRGGNQSLAKSLATFIDDGAVELYHNGFLKFQTELTGISVFGDVKTNLALISEAGSPSIKLNETDSSYDTLMRSESGVFYIYSTPDSYSTLNTRLSINNNTGQISFYDNADTSRLSWTPSSSQLTVTGSIAATSASTSGDLTVGGNLTVQGTTITIDSASAQTVDLGDNDRIRLGDGDDLQIYHDGTDSYISNSTGDLKLSGNTDVTGTVTATAIDGTPIGGTTTAAGSFTTLQADTSLNVDGTVTADGLEIEADVKPIITLKGSGNNATGTNFGEIQFFNKDTSGDGPNVAASIHAESDNSVGSGGELVFSTETAASEGEGNPPTKRMTIDNVGDISFYDTSGNPAFFWDASAESLGIGTTPSAKLHVQGSNSGYNQIFLEPSSDTDISSLDFRNAANNSTRGYILYDHTDEFMAFRTNGSGEALRIDSSQRLLVGKTTGDDSSTVGIELRQEGRVWATVDGNHCLRANRTNSDGEIINLRKDNLKIGEIGTTTPTFVRILGERDNLSIGAKNTGIVFGDGGDSIRAYDPTNGSTRDGQVDLGISSGRFKDLYLSGGVVGNGNDIYFKPDGTNQDVVIKADGKVGIGTTDPNNLLTLNSNTANTAMTIQSSDSGVAAVVFGDQTDFSRGRVVYDNSTDSLAFETNNLSEAMRIDSSGHHLYDRTTTIASNITCQIRAKASGGIAIEDYTGTGWFQRFYNSALTQVGSISRAGTSTNYTTTSDYRLKENVVDMTGAIDRVKALNPSQFNFIADPDRTVDGFLAHEVADVVPEAITGTKDEVDDNGNPEYQGIDQSKLVPLLTGALQEAIARIETLEAQVATLQGN